MGTAALPGVMRKRYWCQPALAVVFPGVAHDDEFALEGGEVAAGPLHALAGVGAVLVGIGEDADDAGGDLGAFGLGEGLGVGGADGGHVGQEGVEPLAVAFGEVGVEAVGGLVEGDPAAGGLGGAGEAAACGGEAGEGALERGAPTSGRVFGGGDDEGVGLLGGVFQEEDEDGGVAGFGELGQADAADGPQGLGLAAGGAGPFADPHAQGGGLEGAGPLLHLVVFLAGDEGAGIGTAAAGLGRDEFVTVAVFVGPGAEALVAAPELLGVEGVKLGDGA